MKTEDFKEKWRSDVAACRDLLDYDDPVVSDRVLSIEEAALKLGISKQTLRNWEHSGRIVSTRTDGGHRRYLESDVIKLQKKQVSMPELLVPGVKVSKLREMGEMLLANFDNDEVVYLSLSQGVDGKVRIIVDSVDGLTTVKKTLNMEETC